MCCKSPLHWARGAEFSTRQRPNLQNEKKKQKRKEKEKGKKRSVA